MENERKHVPGFLTIAGDTAMAQPRTGCPDCHTEMRPIKLIDSTGENPMHQQLTYAVADSEQSWFLGKFKVAGKVAARMCPACGRIILHAVPL